MPFDIYAAGALPHHDIRLPQVQFYHPPWQLAQMAIEAQRLKYDAMLKGLDNVLQWADPLTWAKRSEAMANAQITQGKLNWMRENNWQPYPSSYKDMNERLIYENNQAMIARRQPWKTPGGGGGGGGRDQSDHGVTFTPPPVTGRSAPSAEAGTDQWGDQTPIPIAPPPAAAPAETPPEASEAESPFPEDYGV